MRRLELFLLVLISMLICLGLSPSRGDEPSSAKVRMVLFYSSRSEASLGILEGLLPSLREVYRIEVRSFDVDISRNYFFLEALEKRYGAEESELPVVFVGEDMIVGEDEILDRLESVISRYEALGGCEFPPMSDKRGRETEVLSQPIYVAYFYQRGCAGCKRVGPLMGYLRSRYEGLVVREIDIATPEGKVLSESLCERVGVAEAKRLTTPSVFFSEDALVGEEITVSVLEGLIEKYRALGPMAPLWEMAEAERDRAEGRILERFRALGLGTVMAAGLIDGVNPCAFATLIFFISYMTFVGREHREILLVGLAFSVSVFVTYFLLGLGVFRVFQSVSVIPVVGRCVYLGSIGLALVFGGLSLYDYVLCRRGRSSEMVLQMPAFLKSRVRGVIRKEVRVNRYIVAAGATGFVVSLLELVCTGQVYLPTIMFVSRAEAYSASAVGYLALYNIMFIVPLLGVFSLVYFGTGSERLAILFQQHVSWVKLVTSLFFFLLAGALSLSLV